MEKKTKLEQRLDEHLERALAMQPFSEGKLSPNLLLEGETGTGKTSITRKWARKNDINLFFINVPYWIDSTQKTFDMLYGGEERIRNILKDYKDVTD